jgi:hypothetical protein
LWAFWPTSFLQNLGSTDIVTRNTLTREAGEEWVAGSLRVKEFIGSKRLPHCRAALPAGYGPPVPGGDGFHLGAVRRLAIAWIAGYHAVLI